MAALASVQDMVTAARSLLQDAVSPYRYPDVDLLMALSLAMSEARRLRPDFFLGIDYVPVFSNAADTEDDPTEEASIAFYIPDFYRAPVLYFVVGYVQLRDEEDTQDPRALGLMGKFSQQLLALG